MLRAHVQPGAKEIKKVAKLEPGLFMANDNNTRGLMETWHASKTSVCNWHTVTSTHIQLARLGREAKREVSGVRQITPTRQGWK